MPSPVQKPVKHLALVDPIRLSHTSSKSYSTDRMTTIYKEGNVFHIVTENRDLCVPIYNVTCWEYLEPTDNG